jgi:hypothetical protein
LNVSLLLDSAKKTAVIRSDLANRHHNVIQAYLCKFQGWILDGWPMTAEHVTRLRDMDLLPLTCLVLEVPDVVVEDRVAFRQFDPATGTLYHMTTNPAPLGVGARCITRPGESTHDMVHRLAAYHAQLAPLLEALRQARPQVTEMRVDVDVQESELEQVGEDIARNIDKEMA